MAKQLIAVMGATGTQGGGVVDELLARQRFAVRALTRNPNSEKAKALQAKGCEGGAGRLHKARDLRTCFPQSIWRVCGDQLLGSRYYDKRNGTGHSCG